MWNLQWTISLLVMLLCFGSPLQAASTAACFDTDTKLYLRANGTDASTTFPDYSGTSHTVTAQADAQVDTAQSKFGGASLLLDGTGDYLSVPDSSEWHLGSGDFTIDFWVRFNSLPGAGVTVVIVGQIDTGGNQRSFSVSYVGSTGLRVAFSDDGTPASGAEIQDWSWTPSTSTWYHVAITRSGNTLRAFIDGTELSSSKDITGVSAFNSTAPLTVGAFLVAGSPTFFLNGWLDEVRLVKNTAVWTANFTAPTREYKNCKNIIIS